MFDIGDTVIHPGFGICYVKAINKNTQENEYIIKLKSKPSPGNFRIIIPQHKLNSSSIRYPIKEEEIDKILEILKDRPNDISNDSENGYPLNKEKVRSGNPYKIAEALRDIEKQYRSRFSTTKKVLSKVAKNLLTEEISYVNNNSKYKVEELIENLLEK